MEAPYLRFKQGDIRSDGTFSHCGKLKTSKKEINFQVNSHSMTPNDFLKIIQQETCPVEEIPEGWYCVEDLLKKWNACKTLVHKRIKQGKELGYVTQKKFIVKRGVVRSVPYYKFHEKENNQKDNKRKVMEDTIRSCGKNKRSR